MRLYVGTYAKYNNGSIDGKWLDLDDYADAEEFEEACRELHSDEADPELMFQDVDCAHDWEEELYDESSIPKEYWDIRAALDRSYIDDDIFDAWVSATNERVDVDAVQSCEEQYCGKMSGEEYAQQLCEECGYLPKELPSLISCHIDWAGVWRDLSLEGYEEWNGYVFDTNR